MWGAIGALTANCPHLGRGEQQMANAPAVTSLRARRDPSLRSGYGGSLSRHRLFRDLGAAVEVFFFTEDEYQEKAKEFGSIPKTAQLEGQEILFHAG